MSPSNSAVSVYENPVYEPPSLGATFRPISDPRSPVPSFRPQLPVSDSLARRLALMQQEEAELDFDARAPLDPPRDVTGLARLTAQRVLDRLEVVEQSPVLRQLREDLNKLEEQQDEYLDSSSELRTSLDVLTERHQGLVDDVSLSLDKIRDLKRSTDDDFLRLEEELENRTRHYEERLRRLEQRVEANQHAAMLTAGVVAGILVSLLLRM